MFRIQPGIVEEPIQRTFENVKFALNSTLLTMKSELMVDEIMTLGEFPTAVKIPYFINPVSLETSPIWERGAITVDVSTVCQGQTFTANLFGAAIGAVPVLLGSKVCVVPAGPKIYSTFTAFLSSVDLRPYDAIVFDHEVPVKPPTTDRYVITTQLTFRPLAPFARP